MLAYQQIDGLFKTPRVEHPGDPHVSADVVHRAAFIERLLKPDLPLRGCQRIAPRSVAIFGHNSISLHPYTLSAGIPSARHHSRNLSDSVSWTLPGWYASPMRCLSQGSWPIA